MRVIDDQGSFFFHHSQTLAFSVQYSPKIEQSKQGQRRAGGIRADSRASRKDWVPALNKYQYHIEFYLRCPMP